MNCAAHIIKYILFAFNIAFVACGILLITLGSIMLANLGDYKAFDEAVAASTLPILIIILGGIVFVVSFFGCCGAIRENACCMTTYAILMFILMCLQIALISWMFAERSNFLQAMTNIVEEAWKHNDEGKGYPMDALQLSFKCCGYHNYGDYFNKNQTVPPSCCGSTQSTGVCPESVYSTRPGCQEEFYDFWATNTDIICFAGIVVALVELVAFTFGCCLASSIRRSR